MKKNSILLLVVGLVFTVNHLAAQSFLGPHTSNFDPLKMVYFNPAGLANSEMRWQINLASFDVRASNNFISIQSLRGIARGDGKFDQTRFFKENFNGEPVNVQAEVDVRGPGFMFAFGKNAIAIGTRARAIVAINDLDERFASSLFNYEDKLIQYLPSFSDGRITAGANVYNEFSIAYARKLIDKDRHSLSLGVNVKLLNKIFYAGFTGNGVDFQKIYSGDDSLINVGSTQFEIAVSNDLEDDQFKYRWAIDGIAFDFGAEYTFGGNIGGKYRLKVGAAVNDFGALKQEYGSSSRYFVGNGLDIPVSSLTDAEGEMRNFNEVLDSLGTRTTPSGRMDIRLPSVMHLYADVRLISKLYVFAGLQLNPYSFKNVDRLANLPTRYQIIPRFETKFLGVFAPFSFDKYTGLSTGAGFRIGQVSLGSSNIISSLMKKNFTAVDLFLSLSFGGKRRVDKI